MCDSSEAFEEKGKKIKLVPRTGENVKALVIDQCICTDNKPKCDGLFVFRQSSRYWMILVELKGEDIEHAFSQLAYMRKERQEYKEIQQLLNLGNDRNIRHEAFIVSNFKMPSTAKQKLENTHSIRVKHILHSEATKPVPDIRNYI